MPIDEEAFEVFMIAVQEHGASGLGYRKCLEVYEHAKGPDAALVQKLVKAIRHLDDSIYYWAGYVPKHIMEDKGSEYEEDRAVANAALAKAEAWLQTNKQEVEG
jgi:hypothetical protein